MKKITIIFFLLLLSSVYSNSVYCQNTKTRILKNTSNYSDEINCKTDEKTNPESKDDPIIIKTCVWHSYKFVITGAPDYKGRYSYEYELFLIENGKQKKIQNSELFNDKITELENLINSNLKIDFDDNAKDPETSDCFVGTSFTKFQLNDMGISFNDKNEMEFNVSFGLGGACMNVDGTAVSFKMSDLKEYFKK